MKFVFVQALLIGAVLVLANARTINKQTKSTRTFGNFGPRVKQTFEIKPEALFQPSLVNNDPISIAKLHVALDSSVAPAAIRVSSSHKAHNGVTHVYLQQVANGVDIVNAVANVNVDASGKILSVGNSFFKSAVPTADFAQSVKYSASQAVESLAKLLKLAAPAHLVAAEGTKNGAISYIVSGAEFAVKPIPAEIKYIQVKDGSKVVPVWDLQVELKNNMYNAFVDATTGEVVSLIDWVSDATYNVYPLGINDPDSGDRVQVVDPANLEASPLGWHTQEEGESYTGTIGNNVFAQNNPDGGDDYLNNERPDGGANLVFNFPIDFTKDPSEYVDASTTNLFYWNNVIHDLFYVYGFNEESGNFQHSNYNRGGEEGDAVVAFAQDGSGTDNANFMTPPDGQQGRMRMYVWTQTNPRRDGDLDGGIVMHEYAHGISTRLTGGPSNVGCLGWGESGGMGEGWGDFLATVTRTTASSTRNDNYAMGDYDMGDPSGIRNYVYSTDMTVNPSTYAFLARPEYGGVHAIGEVWAVILYDVFWNVVDKNGFDADWYNVNSTGGNVKMIQLVIDGMKLQPCDPTLVSARDAIIQADEVNNNGENFCELWRGFAKRGVGINAVAGDPDAWEWDGVENFELPEECQA